MIEQTQPKLAPSYEQMVQEIGIHLKDRKGVFAKRILLLILPCLLLGILSYFSDPLKAQINNELVLSIIVYGVILIFVVIGFVLNNIFYLEQLIWVDSYHDGKNLDPKSSWRIARRLFFPGLLFSIKLGFKYYVPPLIVSTFGSIAVIYISYRMDLISTGVSAAIGFWIVLFIYYYYLNIKLRYAWFLFLDFYGQTTESIFDEINKLNNYAKSETFKKALLATLGTDSIHALTQITIGTLSRSAGLLGNIGGVAGSVVGSYGQEAARQLRGFALIVVYYMLYRYAREGLYGNSQTVNEKIYELSK